MTDPAVPAISAVDSPAVEAPISLHEFCLHHSKVERSVELLNGFFAVESHAGRDKATAAEFIDRLDAFARQPAA